MSANAPNAIDVYVGSRLKARRVLLGMSQTVLGERLGITFQQIQKYEKGVNRMGASRLQAASEILGVPVSYFFEESEPTGRGVPDSELAAVTDFLATREGLALNRAFSSIRDVNVRKGLVALMKSIAEAEGPQDEARPAAAAQADRAALR
ncbi:transcriptional regulator [Xaviernesmea oryzae]|uniref:Transcriptional regulator n=1 Tax=Xaviernesmea oryzae TaxID=464029 RepID=A0A1Q9AUJ6_9HYPH|nr:helix-turn-helix transcriptional regulator [Xaviernesmea oryzae]OLP59127.1 transcriptional regulator [Xaviernesmea oryzae]SEK85487.1 Helix-turn-helix domain-containing protein [Xaviernesmea oryzae]